MTTQERPERATTMLLHTTITGHELRYAPEPGFEAFRARLEAMLADPEVREQDMTGVAYSTANPILSPAPGDLAGDRGYVTREVLADPRYHVVADLLARKRFALSGTDPEVAAAEYSVSITEAARTLGLSPSAVQQAVADRRLPSWIKGGRPFTTRRAVDAFALATATSGKKRTGVPPRPKDGAAPAPVAAPPERIFARTGHGAEGSFKLRHLDTLADIVRVGPNVVEGHLDGWQRVAVLAGTQDEARFYELAPDPGANNALLGAGGFFVRGGFKVVQAISTAKKSRALWKSFEPA